MYKWVQAILGIFDASKRFMLIFLVPRKITHATAVCSAPWPLSGSENGVQFVLLQTFLLFIRPDFQPFCAPAILRQGMKTALTKGLDIDPSFSYAQEQHANQVVLMLTTL